VEKVKSQKKQQATQLLKDNNSILILVVLLVVAFLFVDGFKNGFYNVIVYSAEYGLICLGLGLVMITGNIDLSVGFQAGLAGVTTVLVFNAIYGATGSSVLALLVSIVGALITGAITGFFNGFVITKVGVSPLIATIATNYIYKGLVFSYAQSSVAPTDADTIKLIAKYKIGGLRWLTPMVILFVIVMAAFFFWMYKTKFGNRLHVVGDNPEAAAYAGISVTNTTWVTYVLCGVLAAVTGFLMVLRRLHHLHPGQLPEHLPHLLLRHRRHQDGRRQGHRGPCPAGRGHHAHHPGHHERPVPQHRLGQLHHRRAADPGPGHGPLHQHQERGRIRIARSLC
jgi:ribose/xylose/arabinose/galactoside ABC-type transport system permease subunit